MPTMPADVFAPETLVQTLTYWAPGARNQYGKITYGSPVQINGRWSESVERIVDSRGAEVVSHSKVNVDRALAADGYLMIGTSAAADPTEVAGAWPIRRFHSTPDLSNTLFVRVAFL